MNYFLFSHLFPFIVLWKTIHVEENSLQATFNCPLNRKKKKKQVFGWIFMSDHFSDYSQTTLYAINSCTSLSILTYKHYTFCWWSIYSMLNNPKRKVLLMTIEWYMIHLLCSDYAHKHFISFSMNIESKCSGDHSFTFMRLNETLRKFPT